MGNWKESLYGKPGLYKIENPNSESDVLVSANYKLSFDTLRKNLHNLNVWILVIDTKGVNVWCAAGKGTFSTENIINSIQNTGLNQIVTHKRIILPQLGAPGVAAHTVQEKSGFRVIYGPVRAQDIRKFTDNGYKATPDMRNVTFSLSDRLKLIPVDIMYRLKLFILILIGFFLLSGLDRTGWIFSKMMQNGFYTILNIIVAYIAGIVISPIMLPYTPFRAFALKGALWGIFFTCLINIFTKIILMEWISFLLINSAIASFMMMNFTGSTTFTSLSGVKKEMKWALPFQISAITLGFILFIISKFI